MRVRPAPAALLAAAGVTVLAACGSSKPQTFHPEGTVASPPAAPSTASRYAAAVHLLYQTPLPSSPPQRQVALADQAFWRAFYHALYSHGRDTSYLSDIAGARGRVVTKDGATIRTGGSYGLSYLASDVSRYRSENRGIEGTVLFSGTSVEPDPSVKGGWEVSGCVDDARLPDTSGSGRVLAVTGPPGDHYYYQTDVLVNRNGRWLVADWTLVAEYPQGKAQQCKP